ncbi:MAG: porin family protein [Bacteroidota bacterium]
MKRFLLIIFFLSISMSLSFAQTPLKIGLKGGVNFATLFGDTYSNLGPRTALLLGGYVQAPFLQGTSIQGELNYSQEGARNANYDFSSFSDVIYDQKLKYDYINIPILIGYALNEQLSLQAGPQIGVRLFAKENRKIKSGTPSPSDNSAGTRNFSKRIKLIYPSLTAGATYQLMDKLAVQARIFSSIFDNVTRNGGDSEGTFPLIFQLTVSYEIMEKTD